MTPAIEDEGKPEKVDLKMCGCIWSWTLRGWARRCPQHPEGKPDPEKPMTYVGGPGTLGEMVESGLFTVAKSIVAATMRERLGSYCAHKSGCVCEAMAVAPILRAFQQQTEQARDRALIRAYHVTLDALGAPPDEWPCNRAKALKESATREALERACRAMCGWCRNEPVPDHGSVGPAVRIDGYESWRHWLTWPSGGQSEVECAASPIRALMHEEGKS